MAKSKSRVRSNKPIYLILLVSLVLSIGYLSLRKIFTPQPSGVFFIEPTTMQYGNTTITGVLQKSSPLGVEGDYILVLPDARIIILDVNGLDQLVGSDVVVTGNLVAPSITNDQLTMQVSKITVK